MHFLDDSLLPENQHKLVIQVAPYGPQWAAGDSDDIPITMDQQVQKAVDCWNAGATVLHVHVREDDGKGSKRLSKFNEMLARLREAVPQMILQVGGSISFAPESEGQAAKWMSDDTRHMLAELDPRPDQVTVAANTQQMNVMELMTAADVAGTSLANPVVQAAYRDMIVPSNPSWHEEHIRRLVAKDIQPHFMLGNLTGLLARLEPAVAATTFDGEKSADNMAYVDAVARKNAELTVGNVREQSKVMADLEQAGRLRIVGAMYDVSSGAVEFLT